MANGQSYRQGWGIAVLRIVVGIVFLMHGGQKFFVHGLAGTAGAFADMGAPAPGLTSAAVATIELVGGLLLIVGLFARWAAIPLAGVMLGAFFLVHLPQGFFLPGGFEYVLTLLAANITFMLAGGGALALDNVLARRGTAVRQHSPQRA